MAPSLTTSTMTRPAVALDDSVISNSLSSDRISDCSSLDGAVDVVMLGTADVSVLEGGSGVGASGRAGSDSAARATAPVAIVRGASSRDASMSARIEMMKAATAAMLVTTSQ